MFSDVVDVADGGVPLLLSIPGAVSAGLRGEWFARGPRSTVDDDSPAREGMEGTSGGGWSTEDLAKNLDKSVGLVGGSGVPSASGGGTWIRRGVRKPALEGVEQIALT